VRDDIREGSVKAWIALLISQRGRPTPHVGCAARERVREVGDGARAALLGERTGRSQLMSIKALITSIVLGSSTLAGVGVASAQPYPERVELRHDRVIARDHRFERARIDRHWWQARNVRAARYGRGGRFARGGRFNARRY
jgi:hypothetical protein